jgi:glycosyltransferase involved in cell wall biosynthesis
MRLLWFNLATDADDPILGFTSQWIAAVAEKVERIRVVTVRAGRLDLPANVRCDSVGKEKGVSRTLRVLNFYRILADILRNERIDACFSHMIPLFTILSAPLLRRRGIPIVTWYAHPSLTLQLKLAHHLSDRMATSLASTYPYRREKVVILGQGIDTNRFRPNASPPDEPPVVLCAGRLSPVKDHATLLRAAAALRRDFSVRFRLVILGSPARPSDESYRVSLEKMVRELSIEDIVLFHEAVPPSELPGWFRRSTIHVNLTGTGFGDKVALESLASARPTLTANEDFRETLGRYADQMLFRRGDPDDLSRRLRQLLALSQAERDVMGDYLRARTQSLHGLRGLAGRLVDLLAGCVESKSSSPRLRARVANSIPDE